VDYNKGNAFVKRGRATLRTP